MKKAAWIVLICLAMGVIMKTDAIAQDKPEQAIFAGGCFWCMESDFEAVYGVKEVISGYIGGKGDDPTYQDYSEKGHIEAVRISYDPAAVSYDRLLELFWLSVDPTDAGGQFCDRGHAYTTAVFYVDDQQKQRAERSKQELIDSKKVSQTIVTPIIKAGVFYPAEDYHQDYYKKNPIRYKLYRFNCGRDRRLKQLWGQAAENKKNIKRSGKYDIPDKQSLKNNLTEMQYKVTQQEGTEPPFKNEYWDNKKPGIYVDIVSGEPLFSSTDKYKSGTGWPSFTRPLVKENIVEKEDRKLFMSRTEVRSRHADSHLGHVFNDGPEPTGLRYCINSAALRFVPSAELAEQGYAEFESLFKDK